MMISDGESKDSSSPRDESHAFPLLNKGPLNDKADTSIGRSCFKPLFGNTRGSGTLSPHKGLSASCASVESESEDRARRKGFEQGFQTGSQEACSLVREKAAPQIKSFADAFSQWNEIMMRIERNSSLQILRLAVSIAEKILGNAPEGGADVFDKLKEELKEQMREAYRLEFKLNAEDMAALSKLMACENAGWEQWRFITATEEAGVQNGFLRVQPGPRTITGDDRILRALDAALAHVSTK